MFIKRPLSGAKSIGSPRRLIFGVGINDADYLPTYKDLDGKQFLCPYYQKWSAMLRRVYCPIFKLEYPTYSDCTVDTAWHSFMVFKAWMETQDWQGKALDKDLLDQGNKHYGPDTCLFVTTALNNLLCLCGSARGQYPVGVSLLKRYKKIRFRARFRFYGKDITLGTFATVEEASAAYVKAKLAYIQELAAAETDLRVKQALLRLY